MRFKLRHYWLWLLAHTTRRHHCSVCGLPRMFPGDHTSCLEYKVEDLRRSELERMRREGFRRPGA